MGRTSLNGKNMKEKLEQNLEQLKKLEKKVAEGMLEESSIKPGDVIEFGLNKLVGVLESRVVFRDDGTPDINLTCCEFTNTVFHGELLSPNITMYDLSSLGENVKVIGKFTFDDFPTRNGFIRTIKLLTMTIDRRED